MQISLLFNLQGSTMQRNFQYIYILYKTVKKWKTIFKFWKFFIVSTPLRGSLPKSGPLDFATKNTFALFFVGEEALVGVY